MDAERGGRNRDAEHGMPNMGCRTRDAEHGMPNTGCRTRDAEHGMPNTGCRTQLLNVDTNHEICRLFIIQTRIPICVASSFDKKQYNWFVKTCSVSQIHGDSSHTQALTHAGKHPLKHARDRATKGWTDTLSHRPALGADSRLQMGTNYQKK